MGTFLINYGFEIEIHTRIKALKKLKSRTD